MCGMRLGSIMRMSNVVRASPEGVVSLRDTYMPRSRSIWLTLKLSILSICLVRRDEVGHSFEEMLSRIVSSASMLSRGASSQKLSYWDMLSSLPGVSLMTRATITGTRCL